ncbi:MAG: VIT1/CCC1 transporter family protein [Acidimicrobiales bacterium]
MDALGQATSTRRARPERARGIGARFRPAREIHGRDHHHRNLQGGAARAAVFGISDGLVTNVSLILGIAGAHPQGGVVRLAGLAGLVAGAFSMSAGEYVSMRAQTELFQRELALEKHEIRHRPEGERRELVKIYESRGIDSTLARQLADEMMRTPELALETHAREELGINPSALGSPVQAAASSFATFATGALLPLLPWLFTSGTGAIVASVVIGGVSALAVGAGLSLFTRRPWWWSSLRQLAISAVAAAVTFGIGQSLGGSSLH